LISTLLAMWFLATSAAQFLAGLVARMTASDTLAGQVLDPAKALAVYLSTFQFIGLIGIGFGLAFVLLSPFLKRLAHGAGTTGAADHHPVIATDQGQP
jgi:POT family proton-dependent oligopeptide transporter